jgi:hypothetical protein
VHQRLAERGLADDERTVVILQRARHDFRRARAAAVHQRNHRNPQVFTAFRGPVFRVGILHAAVRGHDQIPARQEAVGHLDRLIERTARIRAQVEHQALHATLGQVGERVAELLVGVLAEVRHAHVTGGGVDHEHGVHRGHVDLVPRHLDVEQLVVAGAAQRDADGRAAGPAQLGHRLIARPPLGVVVLDLRDHVAAAHAALMGRRAFEHVDDGDVGADDLDGDPEPVVAPFLALAHLRVRLGVHEVGMGIERGEHPRDGPIDEPVGLDLADVLLLHGVEGRGEDLVLLGHLILGDDGFAPKDAAQHRAHDHHTCERRQRPVTGHMH